ncbi:MAG: c-type cytochrome [Acidobacteria bacterium]|nr:c-type cytochrome [Acidobacteriota bacterium]
MRALSLIFVGVFVAVIAVGAAAVVYLQRAGVSTRGESGTLERIVARTARRYAIRVSSGPRHNPVPSTAENVSAGMEHFADHCASCHANDGSGNTEMGRGLYPKAPDMRLPATQDLSDGELFEIIDKGVRFTGMPAWGTGTAGSDQSTWQLVLFVRHLAALTPAERDRMTELNPRSPEEIRADIEEERFLNGSDAK